MTPRNSPHISERDFDSDFVLYPYDRREAISVQEAAKIAGRPAPIIRGWCDGFAIGRKVAYGHHWSVSRIALQMLLDGESEALRKYLAGDREDPEVTHYFDRFGLRHEPGPRRDFDLGGAT